MDDKYPEPRAVRYDPPPVTGYPKQPTRILFWHPSIDRWMTGQTYWSRTGPGQIRPDDGINYYPFEQVAFWLPLPPSPSTDAVLVALGE